MEDFLLNNQRELVQSGITLLALILVRYLAIRTIKKVAQISQLNPNRARLIGKYVAYGFFSITVVALILIWNVNFRELGLLVSSVFAVLGVALFAQWSILSNVTSGVILFFSFPYKIGDHIRIMDGDLEYNGDLLIVDIRAYHVILQKQNGELMVYPNNLMLQKAVYIVEAPHGIAPEDDKGQLLKKT